MTDGWSNNVTDFRSATACATSSAADDRCAAVDAEGSGFLVGEVGWPPFRWAACEGSVTAALAAFVLWFVKATL